MNTCCSSHPTLVLFPLIEFHIPKTMVSAFQCSNVLLFSGLAAKNAGLKENITVLAT